MIKAFALTGRIAKCYLIPRVLPWATSFCPFRACCLLAMPWAKSFWAFSPYLNHLRNFSKNYKTREHKNVIIHKKLARLY